MDTSAIEDSISGVETLLIFAGLSIVNSCLLVVGDVVVGDTLSFLLAFFVVTISFSVVVVVVVLS